MMDKCHLHLPKPIECTTPRVNPDVNHGISVIVMWQCRFITEGDVDNGGGYACMRGGAYGKYLSFSQFYCEPEPVLKKTVLKKVKD